MRKPPQQRRSRETVEAILQAAARVLEREGWGGLTTNHVAQAAGVSIGSLYQYFPHKLGLLEAVRKRHFDDVLEALRGAAAAGLSTRQRVERLVDGMIAVHAKHPAIHRILLEDAPRGPGWKSVDEEFERAYLSCYEAVVPRRPDHDNPAKRKQNAAILAAATAGVVHDGAHRGTLKTRELRTELISMLSAYLGAKSRSQRQRPSS